MLGLFLEEIQTYLRDENNWLPQFCGIQFEATPPFTSPEWYVAIDDNGISQTAPENSNYMREVARIQIGIWKRQGEVPRDRSGNPMLHVEPYRAERETLESIERDVLRHLVGLPHRNNLVNQINDKIEKDQDEYGWCVLSPLRFMGRGRNEPFIPVAHVGNDDIPTYLGCRLDFSGLARVQEYSTTLR